MLSRISLLTLCSLQCLTYAAPAPAAPKQITATRTLTSVSEATKVLEAFYASGPSAADLFQGYIGNGLTTLTLTEAEAIVAGPFTGPDSDKNKNVKNPSPPAYPKAGSDDAPYDLSEEQLRAALYIPHTFQCGKKAQPIVLLPGTGSMGLLSFKGNYIPLLQGSDIADPVWLNIPDFLYGDAQTNAEYVAYAINYIYGICGCKVAVAAWSQGNVDAQWAYKYWPSTRFKVTDHIGFSPDYHGTNMSTPSVPKSDAQPPANLQQAYNSKFIATLRADGGDAAYVPTTTIYSGLYDEVVEPQQGKNASAYLLGASNNEVQVVCAGKPAGSFYTHEGILYNPLGFALLQDALSHDGPAEASRLDLDTVCASYLSPGLTLYDFRLTEDTIIIADVAASVYPDPVTTEPPIKAYARK